MTEKQNDRPAGGGHSSTSPPPSVPALTPAEQKHAEGIAKVRREAAEFAAREKAYWDWAIKNPGKAREQARKRAGLLSVADDTQDRPESARNATNPRSRETDQFSTPRAGSALHPIIARQEAMTAASNSIRGKLMKLDDLESMPQAEPLIKGILDLDSETWLIGQSGGFKSFVAVDWACHIASGSPQWRGHKVTAGDVLYVVGEGVRGFAKRVKAWKTKTGLNPDRLQVLPMPVQARGEYPDQVSAEWEVLAQIVKEIKPALVVLDTQARMTVGMEENSSKEMGLWVKAVTMLREASGGCVLVVHHTGRNGGDARGSSAIDAAQDMEWKVERKAHELAAVLKCDKSKDGDDRTRFRFSMDVIEVGQDEDGQPITSLVLGEALDAFDDGQEGINVLATIAAEGNSLSNREWVLRTIATIANDSQRLAPATIRRTVNEARKQAGVDPMPEGTFRSILKRLVDDGEVDRRGQQYGLPSQGAGASYEPWDYA